MAQSILNSIKRVIGVVETDTSFDEAILMHINTSLATLTQLGIGPAEGLMVEDSTTTWDAFIEGSDPRFSSVKTYVYLQAKLLFDPPSTSYALDSFKEQIQKFEWRLNVEREGAEWTDPTVSL